MMKLAIKAPIEGVIEELRFIENEKGSEGYQRGDLKRIFEYIAEKYGLSFNTVRNAYYKEVRNKTNSFTAEPIQQIRSQKTQINTIYTVGQIVKVKVNNILDYGAFVETLDENRAEGLIHISEVKNSYVDNIFDYFKTGDIIEAKVKKITSNQKIEFSTKDIQLDVDTNKKTPIPNYDPLNDITTFLNGMVGVLSPKAKSKLNEMVQEHGIVKFTIAMMKAGKTFENDLGMVLLDKIQEEVKECL